MVGRVGLLALAVSLAAPAPADESFGLPPDVLLLARIKVKMEEALLGLPNYACVQTIERSRRRPPSKRFNMMDTLRLEVALVGGKEMFAWPGEGAFRDVEMREMIPTGAIGTGAFGLHARAVFLSPVPRYDYAGEEDLDGRRCHRFDYYVPRTMSGYRIRIDPIEEVVGYRGSFWADGETLDVWRLDVNAVEMPPNLPLSEALTTMRYRRTDVGGQSFLLPYTAVSTLIHLDGSESRNEIYFTNCRQYRAESFLSFAEPPPAPAEAAPVPRPVTLPAGITLELALETSIEEGATVAGDQIAAVVRSNVKRDGEVVVPAGARAAGRLLHLERVEGGAVYYIVGLRFESLRFGDAVASLSGRLDRPPAFVAGGASPMLPDEFIRTAPRLGVRWMPVVDDYPGGLFYVKTEKLRIPPGTRLAWRTEAATHEEQQ